MNWKITFIKTARTLLITATCAQFTALAGEAGKPKYGDAPPRLGLETILQGPVGAASWQTLKGKVVVLEFWATWCGPCIAAIPHLNELADKLKDKPIQFIAVTDQEEKVVVPFLRKKPIHAWIGLDTDQSMFKDYGITGLPHTVVVGTNGRIAAITNPQGLSEELLQDLLAGKTIAQPESERRLPSGAVSAISKPERAALFQVIIRPGERGPSSSVLGKGNLTFSRATVVNILSSSFGINPTRIIGGSALPEGRFDLIVKSPDTENKHVKSWVGQAVESAFGVHVQTETREMDAFVLKVGQLGKHLLPTASGKVSSISSGGGSLTCVNQSLSSLARYLEDILGTPVIDETGATNHFDFQLLWNEKNAGGADPVDLARELREQLGLELAPAKRAVEVLVLTQANG